MSTTPDRAANRVVFTTSDLERAYRVMVRLRGEGRSQADMHEVQVMHSPPRTVDRYCVTIPESQRLPAWFWEMPDA